MEEGEHRSFRKRRRGPVVTWSRSLIVVKSQDMRQSDDATTRLLDYKAIGL